MESADNAVIAVAVCAAAGLSVQRCIIKASGRDFQSSYKALMPDKPLSLCSHLLTPGGAVTTVQQTAREIGSCRPPSQAAQLVGEQLSFLEQSLWLTFCANRET